MKVRLPQRSCGFKAHCANTREALQAQRSPHCRAMSSPARILYSETMSLYKRGNVWWSRIEKDRNIIQRSTKCSSKNNARKVEAAWRTQDAFSEAGLPSNTPKLILLGFENRFFAYQRGRVSPRTVAFYRTAWKPISYFPSLSMVQLSSIDSAAIEEFVQHRRAQGVMNATINNSLKTLRRAMHLAHEWKLIQRIPKIKLLTGERKP